MSPRPYNLQNRRAASEQTRTRVLNAARELIASGSGTFSIDAVAERAGVARMTVYYQFGSKLGLLEVLFDDLAARGLAAELPAAFARPDLLESLDEQIAVFCRFWASDRTVIRRIRAMAELDPEFEQGVRARDQRRRRGARAVIERIAQEYGRPAPDDLDEAVDIVYTLTGFVTYDSLAGETRSTKEVAAIVQRLCRAALGFG